MQQYFATMAPTPRDSGDKAFGNDFDHPNILGCNFLKEEGIAVAFSKTLDKEWGCGRARIFCLYFPIISCVVVFHW